mmetsp:Transcript_144663/g.463525  ORF Transcript_144663/g.463525 Transcript_144663/m.463525 type:complete len:94 (+) Transcript_144663:861-1142(+)
MLIYTRAELLVDVFHLTIIQSLPEGSCTSSAPESWIWAMLALAIRRCAHVLIARERTLLAKSQLALWRTCRQQQLQDKGGKVEFCFRVRRLWS